MTTYAEILTAALSLPVDERLKLADELMALNDVDNSKFEISPAWREEISRRSAEYERGEVKGIPWSQVREEVRRKYQDNV